jgi:predicted aldo/keto reductase-like oxidoreductase
MARKRDMGIVGIKPFAGGSLFRAQRKLDELLGRQEFRGLSPGRAFLKHILENQDLTATIPGMTTAAQVDDNVGASLEGSPHTEERRFLRQAFAAVRHEASRQYPFLEQWIG